MCGGLRIRGYGHPLFMKNENNIKAFCEKFGQWLESQGIATADDVRYGFSSNISVEVEDYSFYLRCFNFIEGYDPQIYEDFSWPADCIVVARLGLKNQRKGLGSKFLRFLVDNSRNYAYKQIGFEECNFISESFCLKFGMKRVDGRCFIAHVDDLYFDL